MAEVSALRPVAYDEDPTDAPLPVEAAAPEAYEVHLPSDVTTVLLGGLFLLALLACCYAAAAIVLPIVLAFVLKLVMQPAMRVSQRLCLPRTVVAFLLILVLFGGMVGLILLLSGPALDWARALPLDIANLQRRLNYLSAPIQAMQRFIDYAQGLTGGHTLTVATEGSGLSARLLDGTRYFASGLFETMLVLFFFLVTGDTFLRRVVEILPRFRDKRQAVEIAQQIERDISAYLLTVTVMAAAVGVATAAAMALCGLGDPLLWGALAFLLNYVPILGPLIGTVIFLIAGLSSIEPLWAAFLPAGLYLAIHVIEGEMVTPLLLARRFTINPVLVVISLVFWYWMWGVPGAILSTPMLAITKLVCCRIRPLTAIGHFIEG